MNVNFVIGISLVGSSILGPRVRLGYGKVHIDDAFSSSIVYSTYVDVDII